MKSVFTWILAIGFVAALSSFSIAAPEKGKLPDLVAACKKECPDAKSNDAVLKCTQSLEHAKGAEQFKKSTCYQENEKYEAIIGQETTGTKEHHQY